MSDLQKSLINQSFKTLKVIEPKKIIIASVLYAVLGVGVAYFASKEWPTIDLIIIIFARLNSVYNGGFQNLARLLSAMIFFGCRLFNDL